MHYLWKWQYKSIKVHIDPCWPCIPIHADCTMTSSDTTMQHPISWYSKWMVSNQESNLPSTGIYGIILYTPSKLVRMARYPMNFPALHQNNTVHRVHSSVASTYAYDRASTKERLYYMASLDTHRLLKYCLLQKIILCAIGQMDSAYGDKCKKILNYLWMSKWSESKVMLGEIIGVHSLWIAIWIN